MKRTLYNFVDVGWFVTFEVLLAFALKIPLIGLSFIPIMLLFMKLFSLTVTKFGNSWVVWAIPYTISSVFFLSFFSSTNPIVFTFKTFWLNLAPWFSSPISPFARAAIFFLISYVIGYLTTDLIEETLNTFLALSASSVIAGIATQYCCIHLSMGFMMLFVISFLLSLNVKKMKLSRTFATLFIIALVTVTLSFSLGTFSKPFTPLKSLISHTTSTASAVTRQSLSSHQSQLILHKDVEKIPLSFHHRKIYASSSKLENFIFNIIIDVLGITIIGFGMFFFIALFKNKKQKRKVRLKKVLWIAWFLISIFFVIMIVLYSFNIAGNSFEGNKNVFLFQPKSFSLPNELNNVKNFTPYISSTKTESPQIGNPLIWIALAIMGLTIFVFAIFNFLKGMTPSYSKKTNDKKEKFEFSEKVEEKPDSFSDPRQVVLFYYKMLRKKMGNPSSTPYEFERYLKSKVKDLQIERVTELFVKLRYAHHQVDEEDAEFMKKWVTSIMEDHNLP